MIELAVVIINYKTSDLVVDCLESLLPELKKIDATVIIVDNASMDDSVDRIQLWISDNQEQSTVTVMPSTVNTGFSGGNNIGIKALDAQYYLLLNSDTLVRPEAVSLLLQSAKHQPSAGLFGPRLEWPDGTPQESCFRFHSPLSELISSANTGPVTKFLARFNVPYKVRAEEAFYDWTSFACVLVRAEVFDQIGLMDDGYFMYFEDVAFAYKAQKVGWKVLNVPSARVVHLRGGSSPVKSQAIKKKRLPRYYYESRTRFFYQTYGHIGLFLANILWSIGGIISILRQSFSQQFSPNIVEKQWSDIWVNFWTPLKSYIHPDDYK